MAKKKPSKMTESPIHYGGPSKAEQMRYQAEDDLRTLRRSEEIRGNKERMSMAKKIAAEEVRALSRIAKPARSRP